MMQGFVHFGQPAAESEVAVDSPLRAGPRPPAELILASGSPARSRLLRTAGYEFRVQRPSDREHVLDAHSLPPAAFVEAQAYLKARDVADRLDDGIVVGADTITVVEGRILGKPGSPAETREMLAALSGRVHDVLTGVAVIDAGNRRRAIAHARSVLRFKPLSPAELDELSRRKDATGSSGGYSLQEGGDEFCELLRGSESNVVGLPLELLEQLLRAVRAA